MLANRCIKYIRHTGLVTYNKYNFVKSFSINCKNESRLRKTYSVHKTLLSSTRLAVSSDISRDKSNLRQIVSSEEVLEKLIAGLSTDIHQKHRVYKNDLMRVINKVNETNFSTKKQGLLLLRCCTQLLADETPATRLNLAEQIWNTIKSHTELTVDHYNELLKVYIDNGKHLTVSNFVQQMSPVTPNIATYELILRALGEVGDIDQATEVISNMKTQGLAVTESVFNSLIIGQGRAGKIESVQEVLSVMKSLKLDYSVDTYTAAARAYACSKRDDLMINTIDSAVANGVQFGETHIMEMVKTLAAVESYGAIPKVLKYLPEEILKTPSITPYMQIVTTQLVFQNHPTAALEIYKCLPLPSFGPKDDKGLHGRSLVRDCVKALLPSSVIGLVAEELMQSGRNPIAIQNAAEAALQLGHVALATDLLAHMARLNMPLRPHYFWPIIIRSAKAHGEKGVMRALSTMAGMGVRADAETLLQYALPHVSVAAPQTLVRKLQAAGLTVTDALSPLMALLLNTGQVRAASEICEIFPGKVDAELILKPLVSGYLSSGDTKSTTHILEDVTAKAQDKSRDWVGRFLCELVRHKAFDMPRLLAVVKSLESTELRICPAAVEFCVSRLRACPEELKDALTGITDETLTDDVIFDHQIPHPREMDEAALESHLRELEAKGLNTRGVLRRLLQRHVRRGDLAAARDVAHKCRSEGVHLSAGMQAAIFDMHVKLGELEQAELALAELRRSAANFTLDEHKVIDFAALAVRRGRFEDALQLLEEHARTKRVAGGAAISGNCRRLLDAVAASRPPADVHRALQTLLSARYCRPDNALLAPIVRAYLKSDNYEGAVQEFVNLANKHRTTPLKHELLCTLLTAMGEEGASKLLAEGKAGSGEGRLGKLVQTVLNVDRKIHGAGAQISVIAAFAEVGYTSTLRRIFLDPTFRFSGDALSRQCARWADERRARPLRAVADAARGLRRVDVAHVYELLLDVYQRDDDCTAALALWQEMQERDVSASPRFARTLRAMCAANNTPPPPELARTRTAAL